MNGSVDEAIRPSVLLTQHRAEIIRIADRYKASEVEVFGSVARGQDQPGSDVDLLVRFTADASLFDQVGLAQDLEDLLGVHVDVVSMAGLRDSHGSIRAEARPL